ncbi:PAS domain-containing sensor histidine kinase [Natrialbaceae archaeon AArc-T1-2]|uniref:PAS domain-containing sensor histidine kinase n=1 Tax=Natrialbaceae archaeon AArc-T1-2 TaxID=3053904 RepID=UPI00255AC3CD|nr:PAS domain-containing protein [Natrialbaceae archaeon AArc-T1-2]WIV67510.1 PAS domain-containing protein [Natrialbaceae archaeon AArc-T1-2]
MVDRITDAFFALDTDWRFTYLNERAEGLFKRSCGELIGRVMWDAFPETVETQFPDGFHHAMDQQVAVSFEVYHTPLETWFEARAYPSETGLSVYMRDVTERKERETKLAQHDAVIEALHDGVVTLDSHTRIVSINDAVEETLDLDRETVVGDHLETVLEAAAVDDSDAVAIGTAINEVDVGNATRRRIEIEFTDAAGTDRVGEVRLVPIDQGDGNIAAVVRDVTDQYEYERVVDSLHEVTRWLLRSDDPEEICAIAVHSGSDLLGLPISGVWLLDDEYGYLDPVAGTAGAHETFTGLPRFQTGEGLVWDVYDSGELERFDDLREVDGLYNEATPLRSEIIAPIGTHGVFMTGSFEPDAFDDTDVDLVSTLVENVRAALDRADRERVLRDRTERLERQTERLEAVADVLSNDLKRQLEAVETALEDDAPAEWEFPLADDTVESTLDRTERLVDDIREFARNATAVGRRSRLDLETAIDAAVAASRLESPSVVVDDRATIRADAERFAHLLERVFDDAADRSTGDVTVRVGLFLEDGDDGSRGFYLHDDASEIPAAAHEDVLEPTHDGEVAGVGVGLGLGLGLGLAVARAIAEAHGWSVSISSGDDGGTVFEVRDVTTLEPADDRP